MGEHKEKKPKSKADQAGGLVFVGCMMVGLGFGLYYGNPAVGVLLGLGVGFLMFGAIKGLSKK